MIGDNDVTTTPRLDQPLSFLDALPFDIICGIFSRLNQRDCLTCMAVCHAWYEQIPQYTKSVWTTLHVEQYKRYLENHRVVQCIGKHARQVTISGYDKDEELFTVLQKLISLGCIEVESLAFILCKIVYQGAFLRLLRQFAKNLTELKFVEHQWNLSFLHVLGTCPRISHFTFKPSSDGWHSGIYDQEPTVAAGLPSDLMFDSLTHLCLDTVISKLRLKRILQRCPNLQCLISSNNMIDLYLHSPPDAGDAIVDFDTLFTLCPSISRLEVNSVVLDPMDVEYRDNYPFWNKKKDAATTITTYSGAGLRALITREGNGYKPDQILPLLQKNATNLEFLWLGENIDYEHRDSPPANWSHLIRSIHAEQLRVLFCDRLNCDGAAYGTMLRQCPALEVLVLRSGCLTADTFTGLETLERLKFVELQHITKAHDAVINSAFARAMTILGSRPDCKLEAIHLLTVYDMDDQMLLAIPSIKTIKTLSIICSGQFITDGGLSDFAELLLHKEGGNGSSSIIENLLLSSLRYIPYRALCAFGKLRTLKSLTIEHTRRVDSEGLWQLLHNTYSLQKLILKGTELTGSLRTEAEAYAKEKLGSGYQNDYYPVKYIGAHYL